LNYATPEFWVFIAFILFLGAVGKRAFAFLTQSLDEYSRKVAHQLEEAERLHDEALSLLNSYKKKHTEAIEQAAKIITYAETEALEFKKSSEHEFEKFMADKEKAFLERMTIEKEEAKNKLRQQAVDEAFTIVEKLLSKESKEKKKLTEASLKEISGLARKPTGTTPK
jgi:F-type H+-transporting ATPase subunit b